MDFILSKSVFVAKVGERRRMSQRPKGVITVLFSLTRQKDTRHAKQLQNRHVQQLAESECWRATRTEKSIVLFTVILTAEKSAVTEGGRPEDSGIADEQKIHMS